MLCIDCSTGDVYNMKKQEYYYVPNGMSWDGQLKAFKVGTVIGVLIDLETCTLHFYKDGKDLG